MCYVRLSLSLSRLLNVRTFCSACFTKGDCDRSRAPYHPPHNSNPRTRFAAPLCQACKAVITRHVVSIGQTATGAPSRSRLISAGDSIARIDAISRPICRGNASRKCETHETRGGRSAPAIPWIWSPRAEVHRFVKQYAGGKRTHK